MGIPAPTRKAFSEFEVESDIIDRMLMSLGYKDFFLCNPNDGQKVECGADVLTKLDHLIGFQVTQYHFDLGMDAETKGSRARVEESHKRRAGLPVAMWTAQFSMPALIHLLQEKSKSVMQQCHAGCRAIPNGGLLLTPENAGPTTPVNVTMTDSNNSTIATVTLLSSPSVPPWVTPSGIGFLSNF
jgi:hypothetical protein